MLTIRNVCILEKQKMLISSHGLAMFDNAVLKKIRQHPLSAQIIATIV